MRYFVIISLILLSGCSEPQVDHATEIAGLKQEILSLRSKVAELENENALLRAGGVPQAIDSGGLESLFPPGSTFEETQNRECFEAAEMAFIESGNRECERQGYTSEDIQQGKCILSQEYIEGLVKTKEDALMRCGPM